MASHTILFREQALKRPLIGRALLSYTALFSSTLGHGEVSWLVWLTEDAESSGAGNERGFVRVLALSSWHAACFCNQQSRDILPSSSDLNPRYGD